ncbi:MAG: LamG-like jellyroll fold domain-containing protein [Gemmataceae bacterium]
MYFRPRLEVLEGRVVPAVNWAALGTGIANGFKDLSGRVDDFTNLSTGALPILGKSVSAHTAEAQRAVTQLGNQLSAALKALQGTSPDELTIKNALLRTGLVRDVNNGLIDPSDITIVTPNATNIEITVRLGNSVTASNGVFDLGLPGVPFRLGDAIRAAGLKVAVGVDYNLLKFGLRGNGDQFFVESPGGGGQFQISVVTTPANARGLRGTIGFFQMTAEPAANTDGIRLAANLDMTANGLVLSTPRLGGSADVNLSLDAKLANNVTGQATFPHMKADLVVHWDLAGPANAPRQSMGGAPSVRFDNVQFGLGSFLGNMTRPIADTIKKITDPLKPVFTVLATKIPGISDLTEAAGLGETSLLKLAQLANGFGLLPPSYGILVDAVVNLNRVMSLIDKARFSQEDGMLPVGAFDLSGNGDLRRLTLNGGARTIQDWFNIGQKNLTDLRPVAAGALESIEAKVRNGNLPGPAKAAIQEVFGVLDGVLRRLDNGLKVGMHFPLLENPDSVFRLLLGQDVSFVTFDARFNFDARVTSPIPAFGVFKAGFFGRVNLKAEVHAGVDTFGLRQFVDSVARGAADPALLKDGFYVRTDVPLLSLDGAIGVEAGVKLGIGVLYIEPRLSGQIGTGQVPFTVKFADKNNDGVLRPLMAGELDGQLFRVDASLAVGFNFDIDVVLDVLFDDIRTNVVHIPIAYRELLNTTSVDTRNPFTGAGQPPPKIDIVWDTNFENGANDGAKDIVKAKVSDGKLQLLWYDNALDELRKVGEFPLGQVNSLKIIGSDDDSSIEVSGGLQVPITVDGCGGNDQLDFNDQSWAGGATARYKVTGSVVGRGTGRSLLGGAILDTRIEHSGMEVIQLLSSDYVNTDIDIDYLSVPTYISGGNVNNTVHLARTSRNLTNIFNELYLDFQDGNNFQDKLYLYDTGVRPTYDNRGRQTGRLNYHFGPSGLRRFTETVLTSPNLPGGSASYTDFEQVIPYGGFESVTLNAANTGTAVVIDTRDVKTIVVNSGTGNDDVRVNSNYLPVTINGQAGRDVVTIGTPEAGTSRINSQIKVTNAGGYTTLNIDDAATTYGRLVGLSVANGKGAVTGFIPTSDYLPTDIAFDVSGIAAVNIRTGRGNDVFTIDNTPLSFPLGDVFASLTRIDAGGGDDTVRVNRTTGPLEVNTRGGDDFVTVGTYPAGLSKVNGFISLADESGQDRLTVNASNLDLEPGKFITPDGLHGGTYSGFENIRARVPSGNNTVTVRGLAEGVRATIFGAKTVNLGDGRLTDIRGPVDIQTDDGRWINSDGYRGNATTSLTFNDSLNPAPGNYTVGATSFTAANPGGSPAFAATFGGAAVRFLTLYGGSGGNAVTLTSTQPFANTLMTRLYTGAGSDTVNVETAGTNVFVLGQGGEDVVNLGKGRSVQGITGRVQISNAGGWSTINIDDSADATPRAVRLDRDGDYGTVSGLAPNLIRYYGWETRAVAVRGGGGGNTFDVVNTYPGHSSVGGRTTLYAGAGSDTINVIGTTSPLTVDPQGGSNLVTIGGRPGGSGELTSLVGDVTLRGEPGVGRNDVDVLDRGFPADFTTRWTTLGCGTVITLLGSRTSTINYAGFPLATLDLFAGNGKNRFEVSGTPAATGGVTITSGRGIDSVELLGTNGDLTINLGAGVAQRVSVGDATHPLERLSGTITVTASSPVVASVNNQATAEEQQNVIDRFGPSGVSLTRYEYRAPQYVLESEIRFSRISQLDFQHGRGKYQPTFVYGTPAGMTLNVRGAAGWGDMFTAGWAGTGVNKLLGPVNFYGQGEDNDFTYYYDYTTDAPHTYTIQADPADPAAQRIERDGAAPFTYHGGYQIIFSTARAGGNTVNVRSVPSNIYLNMVVAQGDKVTFGSLAPALGGSLAGIRGPVSLQGAGSNQVVFDDSGNLDRAPKRISFSRQFSGPVTTYNYIEGLTGSGVSWNMYGESSITVRGGAADETFAFASTSWPAAIRIDGGGGTNTLDYSASVGLPGQVNRFTGEGDLGSGYVRDAVSAQTGTLRNGAQFAPGKAGQAFRLDGTDDFVEVPDYPTQTPRSLTLDAWVNPGAVDGYRSIVAKYDSSRPNNASWALENIDGRVGFGVYQGTMTRFILTDNPVLTAGAWRHVAGTFDVATQAIKIYVDGVEVPSSFFLGYDATVTAITDSTTPARIGSIVNSRGESASFWDGLVDEVGVFDRAERAEVRSIFAADSGGMAAVAGAVNVNLLAGTATGLRGGIARIQVAIGGAGDDVLVGDAGRNLLIGGPGADRLDGGAGEDILLAGATCSLNSTALDAVMAEWSRTDLPYAARVDHLLNGGGLNGATRLDLAHVASDAGLNSLTGRGPRPVPRIPPPRRERLGPRLRRNLHRPGAA